MHAVKSRRLRGCNGLAIYITPVLVAIALYVNVNRHLFIPLQSADKKSSGGAQSSTSTTAGNAMLIHETEDATLASQLARTPLTSAELPFEREFASIEQMLNVGSSRPADALLALTSLASRLRPSDSMRLTYLSALSIDRTSTTTSSIARATQLYKRVVAEADIDNNLSFLLLAGRRLVDRFAVAGKWSDAFRVAQLLYAKLEDNVDVVVQLAIVCLATNRTSSARRYFQLVLDKHERSHPVATCYMALIVKLHDAEWRASIQLFEKCLSSRDKRVMSDARLYVHMADALLRSANRSGATRVYKLAVENGVFASVWQRSVYNEPGLRAKPWWKLSDTGLGEQLTMLKDHWATIRDEALAVINSQQQKQHQQTKSDTCELIEFDLFARGKPLKENCKRAPTTCRIAARLDAVRGRVKFMALPAPLYASSSSIPQCGPTNCRIQAQLGLEISSPVSEVENVGIWRLRVANETREWSQGELVVFDDSFEHETTWHSTSDDLSNVSACSTRLILLSIDMWHPDLDNHKRATLKHF